MKIAGIQKTTLIDYPGILAATVFTWGCNFRCPWCHNGNILEGPEESLTDQEEFFELLEKRRDILDGVVISGGEPTLQKDLKDFILRIRSFGLKVKLDTNGSRPEVIENLLGLNLLDYVAMDVKACPDKYALACGKAVSIDDVKRSIFVIRDKAPSYEFRLTLVPGLHRLEDVKEYAVFLEEGPLYLQAFRAGPTVLAQELREGRSFSQNELELFRTKLSENMTGLVAIRNL